METSSNRKTQTGTLENVIRILVADDHTLFRQGITELIDKQTDMKVVGEATTGTEAVKMSRQILPDIVLMDISLPDFSGIQATRMICDSLPSTGVIALSMHTGGEYIQNMIKSGASGYIFKDCKFEELIQAIQAVHEGRIYLCSDVTNIVIESYIRKQQRDTETSLTDREKQVLQYIADGMSTKKIADHLQLSAKTVETHRRQIMRKLNLFSVAKLTKYAIRDGLTSLEL